MNCIILFCIIFSQTVNKTAFLITYKVALKELLKMILIKKKVPADSVLTHVHGALGSISSTKAKSRAKDLILYKIIF